MSQQGAIKKRIHAPIRSDEAPYELEQLLIHNVMLYIFPPLNTITIYEFEEWATDRLKILRIIETSSAKYTPMSQDWKDSIIREMLGEGLKSYTRLFKGNGNTPADLEARKKDYISHFALKWAYCQSEDLRRWFVRHELLMFRFKFSELSKTGVHEFKNAYQLSYEPISENEKLEIRNGLFDSTNENSMFKIEEMDFYKVPFTKVLNLITNRNCFVKKGFAYVSSSDFVHIAAGIHEKLLIDGLKSQLNILSDLQADEKLAKIVKSFLTTYTGKDYAVGENVVAIENLDQLSKKSYPLCMRMAHEHLRETHKLKHNGRLQYGLFLKGIGVTLEDSLRFWRDEFCKIMDVDKFEKEHRYNIRYNYGKEGSRTNWSPHSCIKVINQIPSQGDCCGCPFKLFSPSDLKQKLTKYGLSNFHSQEVVDLAQKGHYQVACGKYFEITHDTKIEQGINHPNGYFELSQEVVGSRQAKKPSTPTAASQKSRQKDLILKKKKQQEMFESEYDADLWKLTQEEEEKYYARLGQKPPEKENKKPESKPDQSKPTPTPSTSKSVWDDEDDFDISELDESIVMQY
uniref:DNA primase large subunit n=1 Tax=Culicoides sonorensis TaxID=179676 RepID=A0A336KE69_CULSO